jgi:rhomboid protease GluP
MEGEIDYKKHTESELVEMFGRMDRRYAPAECARLGKYLTDHGYVVTDGDLGPGSAVPSSAKVQELIGSSQPIEWKVDFDNTTKASRVLTPAQNDFGFVGSGTMQTDGISLCLSGQINNRGFLQDEYTELSLQKIANVESATRLVRFGYNVDEVETDSMCLMLADDSAAEQCVAILPKRKTRDSRPQAKVDAEFGPKLIAQSPKVPMTVALVAINTLVFIATLIAGAEWLVPLGKLQISWGSNFGPYTTDGEWWRLFTSMFIHFGIAHLVLNMIALVMFGPLVERLYGSVNYLLIYLLAGIAGSLASLSWRPEINSAGASGAIFGILGALLAAQLRAGGTFPPDILRPIRNTALVFLGWSVYAAFKYKGIDNAAHLGGLAAGFWIGFVAAGPITGASGYSRVDMRRSVQLLPAAAVIVAVGFWFAQRASTSIVGDGQFVCTIHWIDVRETATNRKFNAALAKDNQDHSALVETLEKVVVPFWREAGDRLAAIQLPSDSPNSSNLETLQELSDGRADAYQLLDDGLRKNDLRVIATASQDLKQIEETAKERGRPQQLGK